MSQGNPQFATTQWTLLWQAAREDSQAGRPALAEIVRCYWQPLYVFARRQGMSSQDAEDATQEFLAAIVDGDLLANADPAKGKFRTFMLTAWKRFLVDQYRKENALKRGGHARHVPLDLGTGEQNWLALETQESDEDKLFMKSWASSLLSETRNRLRQEYYGRNKSAVFEVLYPLLTTALDATAYDELAERLRLSRGAVKVAIHRMRQKFGTTLRAVVAETIDDPDDIDVELAELLQVLKGGISTD